MKKKYLGAPTPPEDEAISLFAGLLANPDMVLSLITFVGLVIICSSLVFPISRLNTKIRS